MATRTQARELVVELLYAYAMGNERIFDFADEILSAKKIRNAQADFAKGLFNGVVAHLQKIDSIIEANLKSWELSRLGVIDKCILRLGVYEILKGEIDAPVAINEAIEIAKILGAENTGRFVNGVLDAINKQNLGNSSLTQNSSLGTPLALGENFGEQQTSSLVLSPKFSPNTKLPPQNTRIVDSSESSLRGESNKSKIDRFAKSTKSQKLHKDSKNGLPRFAKGKSRNDKSVSKPTNRTKTTKKTQKTSTNSSIVSEKSGLRSHERGNKTKASIDEASGKSPRFVATRRIFKTQKGNTK